MIWAVWPPARLARNRGMVFLLIAAPARLLPGGPRILRTGSEEIRKVITRTLHITT